MILVHCLLLQVTWGAMVRGGNYPHRAKNAPSPSKPTLLQVAAGNAANQEKAEPAYVPSAFTNQQPQRMGTSPTVAPPGAVGEGEGDGQRGGNTSGQTAQQRRRAREPRFVWPRPCLECSVETELVSCEE